MGHPPPADSLDHAHPGFQPPRILQAVRNHPEVFADLRFDVEGLGENLTFEAMILRAWEKLTADPVVAPVLPRKDQQG